MPLATDELPPLSCPFDGGSGGVGSADFRRLRGEEDSISINMYLSRANT